MIKQLILLSVFFSLAASDNTKKINMFSSEKKVLSEDNKASLYLKATRDHYNEQRLDLASQYANMVLELKTSSFNIAYAHFCLGRINYDLGDKEYALHHFNSINMEYITDVKIASHIYFHLGVLHQTLKLDSDLTETYYIKAIKLNYDKYKMKSYYHLGILYFYAKNYSKAEACFNFLKKNVLVGDKYNVESSKFLNTINRTKK